VLNLSVTPLGLRNRLRQARVRQAIEDVPNALRMILVENIDYLTLELLDLASGPAPTFIGRGLIKRCS
jgi:hypothetical protein